MKVLKHTTGRSRRKLLTRGKTLINKGKTRITVNRSNKFINVIAVDDTNNKVLKSFSTKGIKATKVAAAKEAGKKLGEFLKEQKIKSIFFDRAGYLYLGRIKSAFEGVREAGFKI